VEGLRERLVLDRREDCAGSGSGAYRELIQQHRHHVDGETK